MQNGHMKLAADIVAAYVSNNSIQTTDLPALIHAVHASLLQAAAGPAEAPAAAPKEPAVSIKKSVTSDHIVCLEDGKKFSSLKRHLAASHDLTPAAYRTKWGLPPDYPMVAPAYAAQRSTLAKQIGLGASRAAAKATEPANEVTAAPATKRARSKKAA